MKGEGERKRVDGKEPQNVVQRDKVLGGPKGSFSTKMTHRRVPHWTKMTQSLAGGCPEGSWAQLRQSVGLEGVAARGCQLTALLTADQQVLLEGRAKRHMVKVTIVLSLSHADPLLHTLSGSSFTRVCCRVLPLSLHLSRPFHC